MSEAPALVGDGPAVASAVRRASIAAATIAVVLSPIPFADEVALLPVFGWLTVRVARARGLASHAIPWTALGRNAVAGLAVRAAVNAPFAAVPGVAAATNATTAVVLTRYYGSRVDRACCEIHAQAGEEDASTPSTVVREESARANARRMSSLDAAGVAKSSTRS